MGGVETDLDGRSSIDGLFAAGEVACTGVHGANRLASNSLLEGLVFGARAAKAMTMTTHTARLRDAEVITWPRETPRVQVSDCPHIDDVRGVMWRLCGLLRERTGLEEAVGCLEQWFSTVRASRQMPGGADAFHRLTSIVTVGLLVARAALRREESRGGHFRSDFPGRDDIHWKKHVADVLA